jgi:tRNA-2-methylthio-N6-dimethylallyladenosine synthase
VTSYPRDFGDDVLEVMREHPRICRYLHVPGQSGSNRILKAMNRGYTVEEYTEFLDRARAFLDEPEIGRPLMVSGDIIVGFPGETNEDFDATVALVRRARYKNCFIFKYSPRPGTTAFERLADDVPEDVKRRRNNSLLAVQEEICDAISREQVGRTVEVFVEGLSRKEKKANSEQRIANSRAGGGVSLTVNGRDVGEHGGSACAIDLEIVEEAGGTPAPQAADLVQLSGRTEGDQIVFIEAGEREARELAGTIVRVRVDRADRLSLHGERVG